MKTPDPGRTRVIQGIAASPGIAVGKVRLLHEVAEAVEERELAPGEVNEEIVAFREAIEAARREITALRDSTRIDVGEDEARIFDVQLQVLVDPMLVDRTTEAVRSERRNAAFLFRRHALEVIETLEALADDHFSERSADLHDVEARVLRHLAGTDEVRLPEKAGVLLGRQLTPSEAVRLDPSRVLGFATERGGVTSHASIMARARGIPAVVGARRLASLAHDGDTVAVDGFAGRVTLNPGPAEMERFRKRRRAFVRLQRRRDLLAAAEPVTRDGHRVVLGANMEIPEEIDYIESRGADGVGLFRTEFFFMLHQRVPTEEEQVAVYGDIARRLAGRELVVRVLDVGGDKVASYLHLARERNPYLGMRGIRYLLSHRDVFRTQLRALLRAGTEGAISILLPMVHAVDELEETRALIAEVSAELAREGVPHDPSPRLGVMIEVPSAVFLAEEFARRCDFLSLGSNDLMQYLLAVDRDHEALRELYDPLHPAVLRAVDRVVRAGHREGKPVSLCGEMGSDPRALPLILGMGLDRLSVSPYLLPEVKQTLRVLRYDECRELAQDALTLATAREVRALLEERLGTDYSGVLRLAHESNGHREGGRE